MFPETPYVLYMQLQHQGNHRNGTYIFLHESDPRRDHQQINLSFWSPDEAAFHLAVKILSKFSRKILTLAPTYICRLYFPPECQYNQEFVTQPILLSENDSNILT